MSQNNIDIKLVVKDEKSLYNVFNPEDEFDGSVKSYITSKIVDTTNIKGITLTVISQDPLDEEKFRSAISNWIRDEKRSFKASDKATFMTLLGALVFGSLMILLCLSLEKMIDVLQYSLMPILGSLALGKATGILVEDIPIIKAQSLIFKEMEKTNVIVFEYGQSSSASCG